MSAGSTILFDVTGPVATIAFNRPRVHNAMNSACIEDVLAALATADADPAVRVIVMRGEGGKAFSSGADIAEIADFGPREMLAYNRRWLALFDTIERLAKPVIASVEGWATGGGTELSLACDFVVCADSAKFGLAEINIGVIPGAGAAVRLTRWLGRLRAKEILMLGEVIPGHKAVDWHLANVCVAPERLADETADLATRLAAKAPLAIAAAKSTVNVGAEAAMPVALEFELHEFLLLFASSDQKEGMAAFLEKRAPVFRGQ
jgi:enoyl-CoA hydratase/carnithine racemase